MYPVILPYPTQNLPAAERLQGDIFPWAWTRGGSGCNDYTKPSGIKLVNRWIPVAHYFIDLRVRQTRNEASSRLCHGGMVVPSHKLCIFFNVTSSLSVTWFFGWKDRSGASVLELFQIYVVFLDCLRGQGVSLLYYTTDRYEKHSAGEEDWSKGVED